MTIPLALPRTHGRARLAGLAILLTGLYAIFGSGAPQRAADDDPPSDHFKLRRGAHICIIGNTLADRMQHDGWLETYLQTRFPKHQLVVRDLGFSGDELTVRLRSENFGTPDQWLGINKADVVFAFFGYNESFGDKEGLPKFKKDLDTFIKSTLSHKYNGKSAPRLVLFSPIAHENLHNRNLPDGVQNNKRLELYASAMAEIAKANKVAFVDIYRPTLSAYSTDPKPLTINGVHLNEHGNHELAKIIDKALFPKPVERDGKALEKVRQAVLDKNFYWFNRYRTLDGYNVYGGRADLRYTDGVSNREVMQREMEVLDAMTENRDRRIWAVAQGGDLKPDDSNTPPFIPVKTNKPGAGPNGTHLFLDGEKAVQKMTVGKGMKVSLFASEKEFPLLAKPVQMSFDAQGRLWVAVWPSYPHWKPKDEFNDKIIILEDTKGTGKADKCTVWADHLHCPTGFEFWNGGVLVTQAPGIVFLKDTKGKGKADLRVRMLDGIDSADTHHTANSFTLDPGGALYFQEGVFHHSQVETPWGPPVRCVNAGVFRYEPRAQKLDVYVAYGFANPHGHVFDRWGQDIVVDGTGAQPYHAALISGHLDNPNKHPHPPQVYNQRTRPCPGMEYLSSRHFPADFQGNLLVANVIGFQGILRYKIEDRGASFAGTELEPILSSSDPNFRPADLKVGPDGAIYFIDWQNPIIGHMQHHLRDPSRDQAHGRVYRVTYEARPLVKPVKIAGAPIERLLDILKEPEDRVRYRARIELGARDTDKVITAAKKWMADLDMNDLRYDHNLLEALWAHQYQNVVSRVLLERLLDSKEFRARAAATRVLCYWRDRVPNALELLTKLAADPAPRVRLEAIRAASFFTAPEAIEVVLIADEHPTDPYLTYLRGETMRVLMPYLQKAIADGKPVKFRTRAGARFILKSVTTENLVKMKRSPEVYVELLFRKGVRDEYRQEALAGLAKLEKKSPIRVLLDAIRTHDDKASGHREPAVADQAGIDDSVVFDLVHLLTSRSATELAQVRPDLAKMATTARQPLTRQLGFVALIAADADVEKAWKLATRSASALKDLVSAMPLIRDPGQRASLYPKVEPLLQGLPAGLVPKNSGKTVLGRYVRVDLPGKRRTLTLAEVEVYSDGQNVARRGKATQKNTAHGGDAAKAIDGNKSGKYGDGGQTHSQEYTDNPWWEVDLGTAYPISSIVIYNRTDSGLSQRLDGFALKVLDDSRNVVFEKSKLPSPKGHQVFEVGGADPERMIRRVAMTALTSVRGKEDAAFKTLAVFIKKAMDRESAVQAILRIRSSYWPKEEAASLLDSLLGYVRKAPARDRTTPALLDAMQLADALASLLPRADALKARKELGELGVRVIRLHTVPEQMLFDKERLVVRAGKPVEVVLENTDLMPHNFALTQPGALEEIGLQAEATATDPDAMKRHYIPANKKIIVATRLLQPRETQKLSFTAPTEPGVYPYVCTYPGHWRRMYGAMYVVEDLDDYLTNPEEYLTKHPLPIKDALLKSNRPRKEWKLDDLAAEVKEMKDGRSYANGKQMFQVATCMACHKLNNVGTEFGPDLTKLDPKLSRVDTLHDILEPSFRINEKYQTYVFETKNGKEITGIVLEEAKGLLKIIENPLAKAEPVILKASDIENRKKSPTSMMPKGLLDKLTKEEVLDLLAYVIAGGDAKHKLFQGAHEHRGH